MICDSGLDVVLLVYILLLTVSVTGVSADVLGEDCAKDLLHIFEAEAKSRWAKYNSPPKLYTRGYYHYCYYYYWLFSNTNVY